MRFVGKGTIDVDVRAVDYILRFNFPAFSFRVHKVDVGLGEWRREG